MRSLLAALARSGRGAVAAAEASPGTFAAFTPAAAASLADTAAVEAMTAGARVTRLNRVFCRVLLHGEVTAVERDYIQRSNGVESLTTRVARRFSLPLTRQFLRLRMSANQVTLLGFALAIGSALLFSRRTYWYGLAGALIYYLSMVLDCSDGEVARASFSDSRFGAWLETVTDYLSYFVVMAGLVWGEIRHHGVCDHVQSALVAGAASLAIVIIVGYLRGKVAAENPGAFDDALAAELRTGSGIQRFAVWGRQLIKRSFFAHLIVFQALMGHMAALLTIWAYGSVAAVLVIVAVQPAILNRLKVAPMRMSATLATPEN